MSWNSGENQEITAWDVHIQNIISGFDGYFQFDEYFTSTYGIITIAYLILLLIALIMVIKPSDQ